MPYGNEYLPFMGGRSGGAGTRNPTPQRPMMPSGPGDMTTGVYRPPPNWNQPNPAPAPTVPQPNPTQPTLPVIGSGGGPSGMPGGTPQTNTSMYNGIPPEIAAQLQRMQTEGSRGNSQYWNQFYTDVYNPLAQQYGANQFGGYNSSNREDYGVAQQTFSRLWLPALLEKMRQSSATEAARPQENRSRTSGVQRPLNRPDSRLLPPINPVTGHP